MRMIWPCASQKQSIIELYRDSYTGSTCVSLLYCTVSSGGILPPRTSNTNTQQWLWKTSVHFERFTEYGIKYTSFIALCALKQVFCTQQNTHWKFILKHESSSFLACQIFCKFMHWHVKVGWKKFFTLQYFPVLCIY